MTTVWELGVLSELASQVPQDYCIVEIGSYQGASAIALARGSKKGSGVDVFCVDPHAEFVGPCGGKFGPPDRQKFYENIAASGYGDIIRLISLPSFHDFGPIRRSFYPGLPIGLLFIDGDHDKAASDVSLWSELVDRGGRIALHDIRYPNVADAITQNCLVEEGAIDNLGWYRPI